MKKINLNYKRIITIGKLISIVILGFLNLRNIWNSENEATILIQNYVSKNIKGFGIGIIERDIVKLGNQNFIDNYKTPTYTLISNGSGIYGGFVFNFQRTGLFSELSIKESGVLGFTAKKVKTFTELKEIAKKEDLSKTKDTDKYELEGQDKVFNLTDAYFNVKLDNKDLNNKGKKITDYINLKKFMTVGEHDRLNIRIESISSGPSTDWKLTKTRTLVFDDEYPKVYFTNFVYDNGYSDEHVDDSRLIKLNFVLRDRTFVEVPVDSKGFFDVEAIKNKLKQNLLNKDK